MGNNLDHWTDKLGELDLPAMALTMQRVPQLLDSPNTTNADYQRIIGRDPGFTLAIFKSFSNNKFAPKDPPSNLAHAIALLGLGPLEDSSKTLKILKESVNGRARHELYDCYSRAAHGAWYAYSLGRYCKDSNPEEMAVAALLHELAEMMLWVHAKEEMQLILELMEKGRTREAAAFDTLGFTLDQLTATLSERWRLPALTKDTLEVAGAFQSRSLGVMLCSGLARESAKNWVSEETLELIEITAEYQKRDINKTRAAIHCATAKAARDLSGLPLPLTAYDLLLAEIPQPKATPEITHKPKSANADADSLKGASDSPPPSAKKKTSPVTSKPTGAAAPRSDTAAPSNTNRRIPPKKSPFPTKTATQPSPLTKKQKSPVKASPLKTTMQGVFNELREDIQLERVVFATVSPDKESVLVKYAVGIGKESPLRNLQFQLGERSLFGILMKKPQSFWLNSKNREKYFPLIADALKPALSENGFFTTSIFVKGEPTGLIYGDMQKTNGLTSARFQQFKAIAQRLTNQLENIKT